MFRDMSVLELQQFWKCAQKNPQAIANKLFPTLPIHNVEIISLLSSYACNQVVMYNLLRDGNPQRKVYQAACNSIIKKLPKLIVKRFTKKIA